MNKLILTLLAFAAVSSASAATISQTVVRQLWPWSTKVDVGFVLAGEPDEECDVKLAISDANGPINVYANSLSGELSNLKPGEHHVVWDPTISGVTGLEALSALKFTVTAQASLGKKYMVIDISEGASDGATYAVSYLDEAPDGTFATSEYRLNKIVLRRIPAGTFLMGSPETETGHVADETQVRVVLTNDYYMGVFPVSMHQYTNVYAAAQSVVESKANWYKTRPEGPAAYLLWTDVAGASATIPTLATVESTSFLGLMRSKVKSGLPAGYHISLPSEAQWEYACRAGTTTAWNNGVDCNVTGSNGQDTNADLLGLTGNFNNSKSYGGSNGFTKNLGSFLPNAWGLYDCHGYVSEFTRGGKLNRTDSTVVFVEPDGTSSQYIVTRGGSCSQATTACRSASVSTFGITRTNSEMGFGFRLAVVPVPAAAQ